MYLFCLVNCEDVFGMVLVAVIKDYTSWDFRMWPLALFYGIVTFSMVSYEEVYGTKIIGR